MTTINTDWLLDYIFLFLWIILIVVIGLLVTIYINKFFSEKYFEFEKLELFWTFLPRILLILMAIPSITLLYIVENKTNQILTLKVTGHQWYWNYDYFNKINFDSYLESSNLKSIRILETDNHVILPMGKILRVITSEDVLHRWSLPSLGIKTDANPGRLNSSILNIFIPGLYYGHCSEICGANHRFIPIVVEGVNFNLFKQWIIIIKE